MDADRGEEIKRHPGAKSPTKGRKIRIQKSRSSGKNAASQVFEPLRDPNDWPSEAKGFKPRDPNPKHPPCYRDESTQDIGPYIRWLVAIRLLLRLLHPADNHLNWEDFCAKHEDSACKDLLSYIDDVAGEPMGADFYGAFRRDKDGWRPTGRYLSGQLFDVVLSCLNLQLDRPVSLTWHRFLAVRNLETGTRASLQTVYRFEQWLRHDVHPPADDLGDLQCELLLVGGCAPHHDQRRLQLRRIRTVLNEPARGKPIINLHAASNRTGLRALATHVLSRQHRQRKALSGDGIKPGLIYVPLCEMAKTGARATRESVIAKLRGCFGLLERSASESPINQTEVSADLADLRRALSIYPSIVVFDAVEINSGPLSAVFDYIQDVHWEDLFRALVQPDCKTLSQTGRPYSSKFLILSNRPLESLRPWMAMCESFKAPGIPGASRRLMEHGHQKEHLLALQKLRLGARDSASTLHHAYPMEKDKLDLLFGQAFAGAPTELDMTIAILLSVQDLKQLLLSSTRSGWSRKELRTRLVYRWLERHGDSDDTVCGMVFVLMVVASIDGLSLPTLSRVVRRFLDLVPLAPAQEQGMNALLHECLNSASESMMLLKRFPGLLVFRQEKDAKISVEQQLFELADWTPQWVNGQEVVDDRWMLDIRLPDVRQSLIGAMTDADMHAAEVLSKGTTWLGLSLTKLWAMVNSCLAEESLRQATAHMRNLSAHEQLGPYGHRRMIQAIYHGLVSYALADPTDRLLTRLNGGQEPTILVNQPSKGYRYLYAFLFRDCIENAPEWMLSRWFAKAELRFQLLRLFAAPEFVVGAILGIDSAKLESGKFMEAMLVRRSTSELDPALYIDLLEALGRSAYDTGRYDIIDFVVDESRRMLPTRQPLGTSMVAGTLREGMDHGVAAMQEALDDMERSLSRARKIAAHVLAMPLITSPVVDFAAFSFLKLHIDSLQARRKLHDAWRLCVQWLATNLPMTFDMTALGEAFRLPANGSSFMGKEKAEFEGSLRVHVNLILDACPDGRTRVAMADILYRAGEILATEADSRADWHTAGPDFANAYAVYWIADRVRSGAAEVEGALQWPKVSARPMRYYIRVCLKMARILSYGAETGSGVWLCALGFFRHACDRLDVYSRHVFRQPRERLSVYLLLAACARVWDELGGAELAFGSTLTSEGNSPGRALQVSLHYIFRAESLAIELGLPTLVMYRLFFERIKTARRLSNAMPEENSFFDQLVLRDLEVLRQLAANNIFWTDLVLRQAAAIKMQTDSSVKSSDHAAPSELTQTQEPASESAGVWDLTFLQQQLGHQPSMDTF